VKPRELGRLAYEAWAASKPNAFSVPWHHVPDPEAWEAVGRAIAVAVIESLAEELPHTVRALAGAPAQPRTRT
jgi:hypothetical protein